MFGFDQTEEETLVKVREAKRNEIIYGFGFEVSHRGGNIPSGSVAVPGLPTIGLGNNQIAPSQSTFASPRGSIEFARRDMPGAGRDRERLSSAVAPRPTGGCCLRPTALPRFAMEFSDQFLQVEHTTENPLFAAGLGDVSFQVERLLSRKTNTRLQLRYDFNKTILSHLLVPELVPPQDRNIHLSTLSGTLLRHTRDKPLDAHHGVYTTVDLGIAPRGSWLQRKFRQAFRTINRQSQASEQVSDVWKQKGPEYRPFCMAKRGAIVPQDAAVHWRRTL